MSKLEEKKEKMARKMHGGKKHSKKSRVATPTPHDKLNDFSDDIDASEDKFSSNVQ